jgi:hypothetical protein
MLIQPNDTANPTRGTLRISNYSLRRQGIMDYKNVCMFCEETHNLLVIRQANSRENKYVCQKHRAFFGV